MTLTDFLEQDLFGSFVDGVFEIDPALVQEDLISPLLKKPWKRLAVANDVSLKKAIFSAETAFLNWKLKTAYERAEFLKKGALELRQHRQQLATVMAMEMGKTLKDGLAEVDYAAGYFEWFAGECIRIYGKIIPSQISSKNLMVKYEPIGVCGIITPWNFPLAMAARKIAAALAAGCTVVCKPSHETPISLLALAKIFQSLHLPEGVFNVIIGAQKQIGEALLQSPVIRKISFTGSTEVGKYLYEQSGKTLKKLTLELGGHAPFIVLNDAELQLAVTESLKAKFRNNGQTCIAANRFFIQSKIYDDYLKELKAQVHKLKIGNPLEENVDLSTILHPSVLKKIELQKKDALAKGAKVVSGGNNLYDPLILENCHPSMLIFNEETFGPIIALMKFDHLDEGIFLANQTSYGLAAYAITSHLNSCQQLIDQLEYGIIGINDGLPSTPQASFGGWNASGFGREGGPSGIYEYLQEKYISLGIH